MKPVKNIKIDQNFFDEFGKKGINEHLKNIKKLVPNNVVIEKITTVHDRNDFKFRLHTEAGNLFIYKIAKTYNGDGYHTPDITAYIKVEGARYLTRVGTILLVNKKDSEHYIEVQKVFKNLDKVVYPDVETIRTIENTFFDQLEKTHNIDLNGFQTSKSNIADDFRDGHVTKKISFNFTTSRVGDTFKIVYNPFDNTILASFTGHKTNCVGDTITKEYIRKVPKNVDLAVLIRKIVKNTRIWAQLSHEVKDYSKNYFAGYVQYINNGGSGD